MLEFFRWALGLLNVWALVVMARNISQSWKRKQPFEFNSELL